MSKEAREEKRAVTLDELIYRATQLREYLTLLNNQIENYALQASELRLVLDTLDSLPEENKSSILVVLDRLNTVFMPASIKETWSNELIVNIGGNYYVRTDKSKAREIVSSRLNTVNRVLNELRQRYQLILNEYNAIQQVLAQVYAQINARQQQTQQQQPQAG
jgi:prefoldin alpha subunit